MDSLHIDDLVLVGVVSLLSCYQLGTFTMKIGDLRRKYKIEPPETNGPPEFMRGYRAHQNCVEFMSVYLTALWVSGLFFHQVPTAIVGLGYMYARNNYFSGYLRDAKERKPGFWMSVKCLKILLAMGICGMARSLIRKFLGINILSVVGM